MKKITCILIIIFALSGAWAKEWPALVPVCVNGVYMGKIHAPIEYNSTIYMPIKETAKIIKAKVNVTWTRDPDDSKRSLPYVTRSQGDIVSGSNAQTYNGIRYVSSDIFNDYKITFTGKKVYMRTYTSDEKELERKAIFGDAKAIAKLSKERKTLAKAAKPNENGLKIAWDRPYYRPTDTKRKIYGDDEWVSPRELELVDIVWDDTEHAFYDVYKCRNKKMFSFENFPKDMEDREEYKVYGDYGRCVRIKQEYGVIYFFRKDLIEQEIITQ